MSTPIEIVREMQLWRRAQGKYGLDDYPPGMPFSPRQYGEALDAVLRDAERYKALERENDTNQSDYHCRWCFWHKNLGYHIHEAKLAGLADRLREGAK